MNEEIELSFGVQDVGNSTRSELDEFDNSRRWFFASLTYEPRPRGSSGGSMDR